MKKIISIICIFCCLASISIYTGCVKDENKISEYKIDVVLEGNRIKGLEEFTYYNETECAISQLKFNLYANAFRKGAKYSPIGEQYISSAYKNGISYGDIQITSVTNGKENLNYSVSGEDENVLVVDLMAEIFPSEKTTVVIEYVITLANVIARTGINETTINLANFYPILCAYTKDGFYECVYYSSGDPYYSDCANYNVSFTCDNKYTVATSGVEIKSKEYSNLIKRTYQLKNARSFAIVVSENFEVITSKIDDITINYYFTYDQTPQKSMECIVDSLNTYREKFGEYLYSQYSVVQTEFMQGGMEFPALVMISDDLEYSAHLEVIAHETAHQWWQTAVGNNEIEQPFLDEGLVEYSVVIFYETNPKYGLTRENIIKSCENTYKTFCSVSDYIYGKTDTTMNRALNEYKSEYEYVNVAYVKGCLMFEHLRNFIKDKDFFDCLQAYYRKYSYKNATVDDLISVFEKKSGDLIGFIQSFIEGKVII